MAQVFVDAPIPATGPAQPDVTPFFKGPYFEWWNAQVRCRLGARNAGRGRYNITIESRDADDTPD